jgi:hypothetical protein
MTLAVVDQPSGRSIGHVSHAALRNDRYQQIGSVLMAATNRQYPDGRISIPRIMWSRGYINFIRFIWDRCPGYQPSHQVPVSSAAGGRDSKLGDASALESRCGGVHRVGSRVNAPTGADAGHSGRIHPGPANHLGHQIDNDRPIDPRVRVNLQG